MSVLSTIETQSASWPGGRLGRVRGWLSRLARSEGGAAAMFFVMSAPVWLGGLALGAEVGSWYFKRQKLQATADAVAASLAGRVGTGASAAELTKLATEYLKQNQFDFSTSSVQFNFSSSGPVFNDGSTVGITLTKTVQPYLTSAFNVAPFEIEAHSKAQVNSATVACILGTSQTAPSTVHVNSGSIQLPGCEAVSNSVHPYSVTLFPGTQLSADCARSAGDFYKWAGASVITSCKKGPYAGAGFALDPYVSTPDLDLSLTPDCHVSNTVYVLDSSNSPPPSSSSKDNKFRYIRFCDGATFRVARDGILNMTTVVYIFDNSQLEFADNLNTTFDNVAFYFTNNGKLAIFAPNSALRLAPPAAGPFRGILFFGARSSPTVSHQVRLGPSSSVSGAMYFPTSSITFTASGQLGGCLQLIGSKVTLNGTWQALGPCSNDGTLPIVASRAVKLTE